MEKDLLDKIIALRKKLHEIPERSLAETKTKQTLMQFLQENTTLSIEDCGKWFYAVRKADATQVADGVSKADVARMKDTDVGDRKAPVAFRADMDAVCAKSGQPGHYCGHDGHSSILAGLALYLDKGKIEQNRDVYFIFQPAEETGQGAKLCLPLLEEKKIGEIYGLHNIPGYPKNHILIKEGTFACASTGIEVRMTGTPSHAAYPEAGKNPGFALAKLLLEVEKLTEQVNETRGFVRMTLIGMEIGSESYGVSASDGVLRLTVRGERECVFEEYVAAIKELAKERAKEEDLALAIHEIERFPATENHMDSVKKLRACAAKQGLPATELKEPMRWSEDFGYYLQKTEGAFFGIGDGEDHAQLHTEQYEFPDEIIETAVRMFGGLVWDQT